MALERVERLAAGEPTGPRARRVDDDLRGQLASSRRDAPVAHVDHGCIDHDPRTRGVDREQRLDVDHAVARHRQPARDRQLARRRPARDHRRAIEQLHRDAEPPGAREIHVGPRRIVEAQHAPHGVHALRELAAQDRCTGDGQRRRVVVVRDLPAEPGAAPARVPPELALALEHPRHRRRHARAPTPSTRRRIRRR
jgi:hypothetical protein